MILERKEDVEEFEEEYISLKITTIIIIGFIIGLFALFVIGVSKVNAATQYRVSQNNSWTNWSNITLDQNVSSNNIYFTSTGGSKLQFRDTTAMTNNQKYDFKLYFDVVVGIRSNQGDYSYVINGDVATELYNGNNLVDMSDKCTVRHTTSVSASTKRFSFAVDCTGFSGNGYYPYISFVARSSSGNVYTTMVFNVDYRYYQVNTSSEDTNKIINNSDKNTDAITKNQDENTNKITQNQDENTNKITQKQEETNEKIEDINDTLNDSSIDNPNNALNGMNNYFGSNGVISDLLLLPVRMFQSIVNTIDGTCSPFNLGSLLGHELIMPCINLGSRLGNSLYSVIDILISGFFILTIRKKFVDIFNHFTSLNTGGNELE